MEAQLILAIESTKEEKDKINKKADRMCVGGNKDRESSILTCGQVGGLIDELLAVGKVITSISKEIEKEG